MSGRPMHVSERLIGLVAGACAAVVFSSSPASAVIASPSGSDQQPGSYVSVGKKARPQVTSICGYNFNYVQRMTIDGVSAMVPVESVYPVGRHRLVLLETCDGHFIYGVVVTSDPV
ncbi:hypothetical protein [Nocardioides bizhenqiangii]|uniref:Secreted protein n=1 Tax=Nocardioides bizhenqiangii TaxID=3095076 RepID=A0ABZ0ZXJ4_9ACTN|nr:hypothetical protein [Nocardioides sp. HM61]WQQ27998.1 hypothetical protein SHK19_07110 [Nocardioides sp. HM61]